MRQAERKEGFPLKSQKMYNPYKSIRTSLSPKFVNQSSFEGQVKSPKMFYPFKSSLEGQVKSSKLILPVKSRFEGQVKNRKLILPQYIKS
jgi:hypothetical protein